MHQPEEAVPAGCHQICFQAVHQHYQGVRMNAQVHDIHRA